MGVEILKAHFFLQQSFFKLGVEPKIQLFEERKESPDFKSTRLKIPFYMRGNLFSYITH